MPKTINGIGTFYYGKDDVDPRDESYIATLYVVFFFFPLIPLKSVRLRHLGVMDPSDGKVLVDYALGHVGGMIGYEVLARLPLHWGQIGKTGLVQKGALSSDSGRGGGVPTVDR